MGDPACPCLPLSAAPVALLPNSTTSCSLVTPSYAGVACSTQSMFDDDVCECYPESYGYGSCAAHDAGLAPFCDKNASSSSWCGLRWCYVDAALCHESEHVYLTSYERSATTSDLTASLLETAASGLGAVVASHRAARRFFSYDTCGESESAWDSFVDAEKSAALAGETVYLGAIEGAARGVRPFVCFRARARKTLQGVHACSYGGIVLACTGFRSLRLGTIFPRCLWMTDTVHQETTRHVQRTVSCDAQMLDAWCMQPHASANPCR